MFAHSIHVVLAVCSLLFPAIAQANDYRLRFDQDHPLEAKATYDLPAVADAPQAIMLRGVKRGLETQVTNVCGDGVPLQVLEPGQWEVPSGCKTVSWTIGFVDASQEPINLSHQRSAYFETGSWWLLSESTSLLQLADSERASIVIEPANLPTLGTKEAESDHLRLPGVRGAPEFYAINYQHPLTVELDGLRITHVADDVQRVDALEIPAAHNAILKYLLNLLPQSEDRPERRRQLVIVWVGLDVAERAIGGAAGGGCFLSNYNYQSDAIEQDNKTASETDVTNLAAMNVMVAAHEQFHQLASWHAPGSSLPVWVNESLAQYYGLKALSHALLRDSAVTAARQRFLDAERPVEKGLARLNQEFLDGDRSVYPLFYSQGATFWAEVDKALAESAALSDDAGGSQSLDDYLSTILRASYPANGQLPEDVINTLREAIGEPFDRLLERYVN